MKILRALLALAAVAVAGEPVPIGTPPPGALDVRAFGAKGDGAADDTAPLQAALDAAAKAGGGIVYVPTGNYLVRGHLMAIPDHVTLEGVFRAPTARSQGKGSTLLAVEGAGRDDGPPFIFLHANSVLKGITVFYPEQDRQKPLPYPPCIRGIGDNCTILDVLLVNPWYAVDFATHPCGRHLIRGLYSQALRWGLRVDRCLDVGRIEDVHFWPFWDVGPSPATELTRREGVAFSFGRTDWEYVTNCFAISYQVGIEFVPGVDAGGPAAGPGNVLLTQSGADVCAVAVRVAATQPHAGVSFSNAQIYGDIIVEPGNAGPVRFTGCGLFGSVDGARGTALARIDGTGRVSFDNCTFTPIDPANKGEYLIVADGGRLGISNCQFTNAEHTVVNPAHVLLGPKVGAAVIIGNEFKGPARIDDRAGGQTEIAHNVESTDTELHYLGAGGRYWPLDEFEAGTESAVLAPGGDFARAGSPDGAGRLRDAEGWTRVGSAFVEPPVAPVPGAAPGELVMVGRPGVGGEPVGQYFRGISLEPGREYVLSACMWNFSAGERRARVIIDILGTRPIILPAMPGLPGGSRGIFAMMPFRVPETGASLTLRAWFDMPRGWEGSDDPVLQIDRIAITPREEFRPPRAKRP